MNRRRVIGVTVAIALAVLGMIGIVAYVDGAEERAASGETVAEVFVISSRVPAGTPAAQISSFIRIETVPQKLLTSDTVGDLADLEGLVAEGTLFPGEVLTTSRWIAPSVFERETNRVVDIPPGLQEVTISLSPERAAGGFLLPGDTVGVLMSFAPFSIESEVPTEVDGFVIPPNGSTPTTTTLAIHKVLVSNVQLEQVPQVVVQEGLGEEQDEEVRLAPTGNLLVTFAVDTATAERLIFAAEWGLIWLSNEGLDAVEAPSLVQTRATVHEDVLPVDEDDEDAEDDDAELVDTVTDGTDEDEEDGEGQ